MSSADFVAARQRVIARQERRYTEAQTRCSLRQPPPAQQNPNPLYSLSGLPQSILPTWDAISGRTGTHHAHRVGQVDAELLDKELLDLLKDQVGEALKYFDPHVKDNWLPEIQLALRALLFKFSIWDNNASYGAALQGLKYTSAHGTGSLHPPPSRWQKALYGLISVGGTYGWDKWEEWLIDHESEDSARYRILSRFTGLSQTVYSACAVVSFLVFLVNGRYRTLLDRILRIRLTLANNQMSRQVSFEYLNRQLVWHAFTEFLLFFLPLVGVARWRRLLLRGWNSAKRALRSKTFDERGLEDEQKQGKLAFLPESTCPICYQDQNPSITPEGEVLAVPGAASSFGTGIVGSAQTDVTNPYETVPCGCIYCFVCLATRLETEEGQGWTCLRCGELVKEARPWSGDVMPQEDDVKMKSLEAEPDSSNDGETSTLADLENEKETPRLPASTKHSSTLWNGEESDSGIDVTSG